MITCPYFEGFLLNPFQNKPLFLCVCSKSSENIVGKGEMTRNEQFPFSHGIFYPFGELSAIHMKFRIIICKPFQLGRVQNFFVVWKMVKSKYLVQGWKNIFVTVIYYQISKILHDNYTDNVRGFDNALTFLFEKWKPKCPFDLVSLLLMFNNNSCLYVYIRHF